MNTTGLVFLLLLVTACGKQVTSKQTQTFGMEGIQGKGLTINWSSQGAASGVSVVCWNRVSVTAQERINELSNFRNSLMANSSMAEFTLTENGTTVSISKISLDTALQTAISALSFNSTSLTCPNSGASEYSILSSTY